MKAGGCLLLSLVYSHPVMPVPDYQSIMLLLLKLVSDKQEHKLNDVVDILSEQFKLSEEEKSELLPSGQSFLFSNRGE